jgi:hypothetical protein
MLRYGPWKIISLDAAEEVDGRKDVSTPSSSSTARLLAAA